MKNENLGLSKKFPSKLENCRYSCFVEKFPSKLEGWRQSRRGVCSRHENFLGIGLI